MIVYGKHDRSFAPQAQLAALRERLIAPALSADAAWSDFLLLAQMAQSLVDEEQADAPETVSRRRRLCHAAAKQAATLAARGDEKARRRLLGLIDGLAAMDLPAQAIARGPEGFAFYDLHPAAWFLAGQALRAERDGPFVVLGLRSIGMALGACVAAGCNALAFETVRPHGPPFARRITTDALFAARVTGCRGVSFIIVDEGPGLSGSSIAGAVTWLEGCGVTSDRILILPSHDGAPGPAATADMQAAWRRAVRRRAPLDGARLDGGPARWFAETVGDCEARDLSGGLWRNLRPDIADSPVDAPRERRKFLLRRTDGRRWITRFIGLGEAGAVTQRRARILSETGFVAPICDARRGHALLPWIEGTQPARSLAWAAQAGLYLARRAALLPVCERGASLAQLAHMACFNIAAEHGEDRAREAARILHSAEGLQKFCRPVEQDGRVHRHEWVETPKGLFKTDAYDHCASHDLIGCQDVAWDFAGLAVEHGDAFARLAMAAAEQESGRAFDPRLFQVLRLCWIGFETGLARLAMDRAAAADRPALAARLRFLGRRLPASDGPDSEIAEPGAVSPRFLA